MTEDWGSRLGFAEEFCEIWRFKKKVCRHVNTYCLLITQLHFVTIVAGSNSGIMCLIQDFQEQVVEEVKVAIRPFYASKQISKDQYKEILRKCVPKVLSRFPSYYI